jgi:uncharacterized secreted protein with C-terminal beta-propeller domain
MTDAFERKIGDIDAPRPLDQAFRDRLERAMMPESGVADSGATRWSIDGPRDLSRPARSRIESALTRRKRWVLSPVKMVAAAVAVLLVASATIVVVDRVGTRGSVGEDRPFVAAPSSSPSTSPSPSASPSTRPVPNGPATLRGFTSADRFLAYVRQEGLEVNGPYGIPGSVEGGRGGYGGPSGGEAPAMVSPPAAPQAGTAYSTTNIQEAGVDEPDIVKTDGRNMVVLSESTLRLFDVKKGANLKDTLKLSSGFAFSLFLAGDRVIVLSSHGLAPAESTRVTHVEARTWTSVTAISIADPENIKVLTSMDIEGEYVDARLVGGVVRLVVRSPALGPEPVFPAGDSAKEQRAAEQANERSIRSSSVGDWVPHFVLRRTGRATTTGHVLDWSAVSRPPERGGLGMVTVLTFDPANPRPDNAASVVGAGDQIYASVRSLYITSQSLSDTRAAQESIAVADPITRVHKFDIGDPTRAMYVASGDVPGYVLNQFSMSEYAGRLRVATTLRPFEEGFESSQSFVTILSDQAGRLVTAGSAGNLGKGERIYSVRFVGPMAYVVTFRELDPLYVVDLSKANRPKVRGQLKIPGYSEYLHPISDALLLGVGRDADKTGEAKGLQFSLFDVSDPTSPRRLHNLIEGAYGYSGLDYDHHAFLYWDPKKLVVVPASISAKPYETGFVGALALTVDEKAGFGDPTRITHVGRPGTDKGSYPNIERAVVVGSRLFTISSAGILLSDLDTLDDRAWVPFRS